MSQRLGSVSNSRLEMANRFVMTLAPLGASIWLAHLGFHLFVGSHTFIPVFQRLLTDVHFPFLGAPAWNIRSWLFQNLSTGNFPASTLECLPRFTPCGGSLRGLERFPGHSRDFCR